MTSQVALAVLSAFAGAADAQVTGQVRDAWTEQPAHGALVTDAETGEHARTDIDGRFLLAGSTPGATLYVTGAGLSVTRFAVRSPRAEGVTIDAWPRQAHQAPPVSWQQPRPPGPPSQPMSLPRGPLLAVVDDGAFPESIRVGRRFAGSCRDNPVQRIDTIDLDDYVKGVVNAEVGVFRAVQGGVGAATETWAAFGVGARSYALWFYLRDPDADFHIDDTACNQVYKDARNPDVDAAVERSAGVIMVKTQDGRTLDKLEYAASCGEHGTLPEYGDAAALVPDAIPERACAGNWCGHDNCGGHQVNPAFPDEGRCLVRGICQWGAVERSMRGDSWREILAHYQPHLTLIAPNGDPGGDEGGNEGGEGPDVRTQTGSVLGFVRADSEQGEGIEGARVAIVRAEEVEAAFTDAEGFYRIDEVPVGPVLVQAEMQGRHASQEGVIVGEGGTHWVSFALLSLDGPGPDVPGTGEGEDGGEGSLDGPSDDPQGEGEGEGVVADGRDPNDPVGPPGAAGDVRGAAVAPTKRRGSAGCASMQPVRELKRFLAVRR